MLGTGLTMEGIFQNAATFDLMNENSYRATAVADVSEWAEQYSHRRYNAAVPAAADAAANAWRLFAGTAFNVSDGEMVSKDTLTAIPYGKVWDKVYGTDGGGMGGGTLYNETEFTRGWAWLLKAAALDPTLAGKSTFTHDLVDVTRQAIAKHASKVYRDLDSAANANSTARFAAAGKLLLEALDDADLVLGSSEGFLFGAWLASARQLGTTPAERQLYGWNAAMQVTFWEYPQPDPANSSAVYTQSSLQDYACKQWSGLISSYYKPRWELYINQTLAQLKADPKATFDIARFHSSTFAWFDAWQSSAPMHDFPAEPAGDSVAISKALYAKYGL